MFSIGNMRLKLGKLAKPVSTHKCFIKLARKYNEHSLYATQNLTILFLSSQLSNLGCYCHWKSLNLRNIKASFDEILRLRNISYKKCVEQLQHQQRK